MDNLKRKKRIRYKIKSISKRERLTVFKSNNHLYAQIINDIKGKTLASVSSLEKDFRNESKKDRLALAEKLGKEIAKRSIEKGIKEVTFDICKFNDHGFIKILSEASRAGGLDF